MPLFSELKSITNGTLLALVQDEEVLHFSTDSRSSLSLKGTVFFAIAGENHDGHDYVEEVYNNGVRNIIVERRVSLPADCNVLQVHSAVAAMQAVSAHHRKLFDLPVIGITGSNGKTITKEWLYKMLSPFRKVVKNPRSYNSQIGVPLSVWHIGSHHEIGVFEAGISKTGEMEALEEVIRPTLGIFTNLRSAHDEGFKSRDEKALEKSKLFKNAERVIYCKDHCYVDNILKNRGFTWGFDKSSDVVLKSFENGRLSIIKDDQPIELILNDTDAISMENAMHCITLMIYLNFSSDDIQRGLNNLAGLSMRLELKKGIEGSYLIDDTYNNDLDGLQSALSFLQSSGTPKGKVLILSDILQSGLSEELLYTKVSRMVAASSLESFIGVGVEISKFSKLFPPGSSFYQTAGDLASDLESLDLSNKTILVKGARTFQLEKIVRLLEEKNHGTRFEVNLDALTDNLNFYRSNLKPKTKLMVMVKAFGYGAGSYEVANLLEYHNVDYLGVAYTDEGVFLRERGVRLPIMVMNPSPDSFDKLVNYALEPEIYSLNQLQSLIKNVNSPIGIHLKLETGMNRLGFLSSDLEELIQLFKENPNVQIKSIFSHLAASDEEEQENFSHGQVELFERNSKTITAELNISPIRHILNSTGILRFPQYHFEMVRLGIGLYGIDGNGDQQKALQAIGTLKTVVSQLKKISKGETIGYGRKGVADRNMIIAIIAIGYADGYSRAFSNGTGVVWVNGKRAPVIGNVCMDMTMIDVTDISVEEGDEVEIFGDNLHIQEVAERINTIPYEILAGIGARVKRTYYSG